GCESEPYLELDTEDQVEVLRAFQQTWEEAVRRFDGTVVQGDDQGLLACFGYPVVHEDAAGRAARAALALLEQLKALRDQIRCEHELEVEPWVALHTGSALVEVGEGGVSLAGEARNGAARRRDGAEPGQ